MAWARVENDQNQIELVDVTADMVFATKHIFIYTRLETRPSVDSYEGFDVVTVYYLIHRRSGYMIGRWDDLETALAVATRLELELIPIDWADLGRYARQQGRWNRVKIKRLRLKIKTMLKDVENEGSETNEAYRED